MAYDAITAGEADANSPADATLWGKVKDNFADHETRVASNEGKVGDYAVGDTLKNSADTQGSIDSLSYVEVRRFPVTRDGALRIKFDLQTDDPGSYSVYGRIYKNGAAVGTERSKLSSGWETFSEDISSLTEGDMIELHVHYDSGGAGGDFRNFRLYTS